MKLAATALIALVALVAPALADQCTDDLAKIDAALAGNFQCLQIVTIHDLFAGKKPQIPFSHREGLKKTAKESSEKQGTLL